MLTKTNIEYGEMNWNIYRGCLHKQTGYCPIPNCWAEAMAKRQGWDFHKPELLTDNLLDPIRRKKPTRILVNFMGDLFGDWIGNDVQRGGNWQHMGNLRWPMLDGQHEYVMLNAPLQDEVKRVAQACPQHTFLFLTKNPANIWRIEWPANCWMGVTVWSQLSYENACYHLDGLRAAHKWLSIEPLLKDITPYPRQMGMVGIDWVVIGAQTNPTVLPDIAWVHQIREACDLAGIPIWYKNNLKLLLGSGLRQELPKLHVEALS